MFDFTDQGPRDMGPDYHPGFDDDPPRGGIPIYEATHTYRHDSPKGERCPDCGRAGRAHSSFCTIQPPGR
jgi:hypothetical protein